MDTSLYHAKLRSPNRIRNSEITSSMAWENPSSSYTNYDTTSHGHNVHTPNKIMTREVLTPHKSGYFLRTPSPLKKLRATMSPSKVFKIENPGTPSPQKANSATDLFGNKSLLENLEVPEDWDENFLNNFQDDWLFGFGIGSEDLENLTKSPLKSPKRGLTFLNNTPKKFSGVLSPFKSPLLTSSPKLHTSSPAGEKTPGGRPLTRQRKLFLQSPEHQVPQHSAPPPLWSTHIPFPPVLDSSTSSRFTEGGSETSIQSISSYLKNFDEDDHQDDLPVMPPVGWTTKAGKVSRVGKPSSRGVSSKSSKSKRDKTFTTLQSSSSPTNINCHPTTAAIGQTNANLSKKVKNEPQFTLLRPFTDFHTNQISLRTTPVTPPNKIKISRDFSQIQTLPSKEQLRIVRHRFRDTLNKAVQQAIEKEKSKRGSLNQEPISSGQLDAKPVQQMTNEPQQQLTHTPIQIGGFLPQCGIPQFIAVKPPVTKKRKR